MSLAAVESIASTAPLSWHRVLAEAVLLIRQTHVSVLLLLFTALVLFVLYRGQAGSCALVVHYPDNSLIVVERTVPASTVPAKDDNDGESAHQEQPTTTHSGVQYTTWDEYLHAKCPSLQSLFHATPYLPNGHLQTLCAALGLHRCSVEYTRDMLTLPDGGEIALDWANPRPDWPPYKSTTPTVVILHGLTGGSHETYVQEVITSLYSPPNFVRCVVVNFRGCANSELKTSQLYCGAYTDDFRAAVKHIRKLLPHARLSAIGYSLGSNVLVKYLGEEGDNVEFCGAVSVCNPFDFVMSSRTLVQTWVGRHLYSRGMASSLKKAYLRHVDMISTNARVQRELVLQAKTVWEFDDRVTRVVFNYLTVDDYYADASSCNYIGRVRCPLLCFNALDDPISPKEAIPYRAARKNPYVTIATSELGGHIGFYEGITTPSRKWVTKVFAEYLAATMSYERVETPVPVVIPEPSPLQSSPPRSRGRRPTMTPATPRLPLSKSKERHGSLSSLLALASSSASSRSSSSTHSSSPSRAPRRRQPIASFSAPLSSTTSTESSASKPPAPTSLALAERVLRMVHLLLATLRNSGYLVTSLLASWRRLFLPVRWVRSRAPHTKGQQQKQRRTLVSWSLGVLILALVKWYTTQGRLGAAAAVRQAQRRLR